MEQLSSLPALKVLWSESGLIHNAHKCYRITVYQTLSEEITLQCCSFSILTYWRWTAVASETHAGSILSVLELHIQEGC